jgi:hypothetical protein
MRNIERMFQLFVSLQILFGSRRGIPFLLPLLLVGALIAGGWFLFSTINSPERQLEKAHADWDSGVALQQIAAIKQYRKLLQMSDPLEPGMRWLRQDRDTLYRRIIQHEVLYEDNNMAAREWIIRAIDEGIQDLRLADGKVKDFWDKTVNSLSNKPGLREDRQPEKDSRFRDDERLNQLNGILDLGT